MTKFDGMVAEAKKSALDNNKSYGFAHFGEFTLYVNEARHPRSLKTSWRVNARRNGKVIRKGEALQLINALAGESAPVKPSEPAPVQLDADELKRLIHLMRNRKDDAAVALVAKLEGALAA